MGLKTPLFVLYLSHKSDKGTRSKHMFPIYVSFFFFDNKLILINNSEELLINI